MYRILKDYGVLKKNLQWEACKSPLNSLLFFDPHYSVPEGA